MFGTLFILDELQRGLIVANTSDGLAAARARGRKGESLPYCCRSTAKKRC